MPLGATTGRTEAPLPGRVGIAAQVGRVARRRRLAQAVAVVCTAGALLLALLPLADIVITVATRALPALSLHLFTQDTNGVSGGLENAVLGSLVLTGLGIVAAGTVGIAAGVYLAEWSPPALARILRFTTDVLAGVPSIVIGYFGYIVFVSIFGWGFSLLAGALALAMLMLPYVVRASELAVRRVPRDLKEAGLALGVSRTVTTHRLTLRLAAPSILTGLLTAVSVGVGETAPLLYTAEWSNFNPQAWVHAPVGYLTYVVWTFIQEPFSEAHALAYAAAFLLMVAVLTLNLVARWLVGATRAVRLGRVG